MNDYRAHYFPKFTYKPTSIKSTLRFGNPAEAIGSVFLFIIWFAVAAIGYILCGALFICQVIIWVIGKLGSAILNFNVGTFIGILFLILIILLAVYT